MSKLTLGTGENIYNGKEIEDGGGGEQIVTVETGSWENDGIEKDVNCSRGLAVSIW